MQVQQVISNLREQERVLRGAAEEVGAALRLLAGLVPNGAEVEVKRQGKSRKKMSKEARAKIAAAATARWAARRAAAEAKGGKK